MLIRRSSQMKTPITPIRRPTPGVIHDRRRGRGRRQEGTSFHLALAIRSVEDDHGEGTTAVDATGHKGLTQTVRRRAAAGFSLIESSRSDTYPNEH